MFIDQGDDVDNITLTVSHCNTNSKKATLRNNNFTCAHAVAHVAHQQSLHKVQATVRHVLELLVRKGSLQNTDIDTATMDIISTCTLLNLNSWDQIQNS